MKIFTRNIFILMFSFLILGLSSESIARGRHHPGRGHPHFGRDFHGGHFGRAIPGGSTVVVNEYLPGYSPIYQGDDPGAEGIIGVINY